MSPPPLPADKHKDPPRGRKFPCRQCGAKLDFDPAARGLKCPYCGFTEVIPEGRRRRARGHPRTRPRDISCKSEHRAEISVSDRYSQVKCDGCGAVVVVQDRLATDKCPYCSTHLDNKPEAVKHLILPESVLPFAVSDREALGVQSMACRPLVRADGAKAPGEPRAVRRGLYAVLDLRRDDVHEVHRPARRRLLGHRVVHGPGGHASISPGAKDPLALRVRRGSPLLRRRPHQCLTLPAGHLVDRMRPWELGELEPFREEFLSGHLTERYSVSLTEGFDDAKGVMENTITGLIHRDIGGDHQRISSRRTNHVGVTFKHTLLPVWVANYRYRERLFQVLVNGRTGRVAGDRPWSWWKIVRLVLLILFAILLALVLVNTAKGQMADPIQKEFSEPRPNSAAGWSPGVGLGVGTSRSNQVTGRGVRSASDDSAPGRCAGEPRNLQDVNLGTALHDPNPRRGFRSPVAPGCVAVP